MFKVNDDFLAIRTIDMLGKNLSCAEREKLDEDIKARDLRAQKDGFYFNPTKRGLISDVRKIDKLELFSISERMYLSHIFSRLLEAVELYAANSLNDNYDWYLSNECSSLKTLNDEEYFYFISKYYNLCRESLWKDDLDTLIDSITAASFLALHYE